MVKPQREDVQSHQTHQTHQTNQIILHENTLEEEENAKFEEATENLRLHYQEKLDIATEELNKSKLEVQTLKMSISEVGNQRDFYFSKLRDIEMLVVKNPSVEKEEMLKVIKSVLFSEKEVELVFDESGVNVRIR